VNFNPNPVTSRTAPINVRVRVTARGGRPVQGALVFMRGTPRVVEGQTVRTGADGVALLTEWNEFKFLNLERLCSVMRRPLVFDGRNLWEPERMRRVGFEYHSIGRKPVLPA